MSAHKSRLGQLPLDRVQHYFSAAARVLRGGQTTDVLALRPERVCANSLTLLSDLHPRLGATISTIVPFALLWYGLHKYVWKAPYMVWLVKAIGSRFRAEVTVPTTHRLNKPIMLWLTSRTKAGYAQSYQLYDIYNDPYDDDEDEQEQSGPKPKTHSDTNLDYVPTVGTYEVPFKGRMLKFELSQVTRQESDGKGGVVDVKFDYFGNQLMPVLISCSSVLGGMGPIQAFLEHIHLTTIARKPNRITVFRPKDDEIKWDFGLSRPARKLESVALDKDVKQPLIDDIQAYLAEDTELWYANRGLPHRRGYLFHGPPGTGKTSFCSAIAGHFELDVYIISMTSPGMNDKTLQKLFDLLPDRCVILLEDIDSAGVQRQSLRAETTYVQPKQPDSTKILNSGPVTNAPVLYPGPAYVTLGGLLNTIDGPCSKDGRILIMTTNTPESLDKALIRPGRIDRKVLFGNASIEMCTNLFQHIFTKTPGEIAACDDIDPFDSKRIDVLAHAFAAEIPPDQLSPAEVQGYLMVHRKDPSAAVALAKTWVLDLTASKKKGASRVRRRSI